MYKTLMLIMFVLQAATVAVAQTAPAPETEEDDQFEWSPTAYVQFDFRSFTDWDLPSSSNRLDRDEVEVRRFRAGVEGSWRNATFELKVDPFDNDGVFVKDADIAVRFRKWLRLRAGHFKLPGGREYHTSSRRLGFLERSPIWGLSAGRDLGAQVQLRPGAKVRGELGLFAGDGLGRQSRAGLTAAGRVAWNPFAQLDLGASGSLSQLDGVADSEEENGVNGRSATGYRFFDRLYVQGRRSRIGADARWRSGSWQVNAEVLRLQEQRHEQAADLTDLPDLFGNGLMFSARWNPGRPQISIRYDRLSFDDVGPATDTDGNRPRISDVRPRGVEGFTLSGGWQFSRWLTVLGETSAEWYSEPTSAPSLEDEGPYMTFGVRLQIELR